MNVESLLALAGKCKTEKQTEKAFREFKDAFTQHFTKRLAHLNVANDDYQLEKPGEPFFQFEVNYQISNEYIICAKVEIRNRALVVYVIRNRMLDKAGMSSQSWESNYEDEELLEFSNEDTVSTIVKTMVNALIEQHADLLEPLVLTRSEAEKTAGRVLKHFATAYTRRPVTCY